jgi:hypothetical protein
LAEVGVQPGLAGRNETAIIYGGECGYGKIRADKQLGWRGM